MYALPPGGIDCDLHPAVPSIRALHPHLSDHWREASIIRGMLLLFATDYPHWDYDDPAHTLPMAVPENKRRDFFLNNALSLYGQPGAV